MTADVNSWHSASHGSSPRNRSKRRTGKGRVRLIVWLWEATGDSGFACGVSDNQAGAQEAAGACMASGNATTAVVQSARLVDSPDTLDPHYVRFGSRWQATVTRSGKIHWRESAAQPAGGQ